MRVFVLALDGLSYELVHLWDLKHLKQKKYGKFPSIINRKHGEPLSPQVWGSFITGVIQNIDDWKIYSKPIEWIRWNTPLKLIRGSEAVSKTFGKKILIPILEVIKRQKKYAGPESLRGAAIFDLIPQSIAVNVPMYNLDSEWLFRYTRKILEGDIDAFEKHVLDDADLMIRETFGRMHDDWVLFMTWIPIADQMGHVFTSKPRKIRGIYERLNMLAHRVSSKLPKDCLLVIVSDHGMKVSPDGVSGCHTDSAFYSVNEELDWNPNEITDFYDFIKFCVMHR